MKNEYLGHPLVSSSFVHEHFSPALKQEKVKKSKIKYKLRNAIRDGLLQIQT